MHRKYFLILLVLVIIDSCLRGGFVHEEDFKTHYHRTKTSLPVSSRGVEKELTSVTATCDTRSPENLDIYEIITYLHISNFFCSCHFFKPLEKYVQKSIALLKQKETGLKHVACKRL